MKQIKIILGLLLIFGGVSELLRVISDYTSRKLTSWPFGVEIGAAIIVLIGIFLARSGIKAKRIGN